MKEIFLTSSVLILALLALRRVFRRTISRRLQYALWGLVLLRLLVPVSLPAAGCSVLTAVRPVEQTVARRLEERPIYLLPVETRRISLDSGAPSGEPTVILPVEGRYVEIIGEQGEVPVMTSYAMTLEEALLFAWIAGAAVMGIWMLAANFRFWRKLCKVRKPCKVEGARYPVYLVEEGLPSPCLFGLFRPAVYLTPAAASPERLRHVLAHEETHGRHGDPLWALLRCVCLAVYWFNPLVWAAALAAKTDCELACDEAALERLGESERIAYGRTLLSLIPVRRVPANPLLAATTMTAGKRRLKDRITRVAENRKPMRAALLAVLLLSAAVCAVTFTGAASKTPVPLAEAELAEFNQDFFGGEEEQNLRRRFLNSFYTCPQDVDIFEFLWWDPPSEEPDADWTAIGARTGEADYRQGRAGIGCNTAKLDQVFQENLGLTLEEMNGVGMEKFTVLDEEGVLSFEGRLSDTGVLHISAFTAGEREGDLVRLYYDAGQLSPLYAAQACLTLRERPGGTYWIVSNQAGPVPDGPLSGEDLQAFTRYFEEDTLLRQLLSSYYAAPEEIDLVSLFYNGVGRPPEEIREEERQAAALAYGWEDPGVDLFKIPAEDMDALLYSTVGLYLEETDRVGLERFIYLPEYDAYYDFHGDTNLLEPAFFSAGEWKDGRIRLYYDGSSLIPGEGWACLTLRDTPAGCRVVSNLPCEKPAIPTMYPAGDPWMAVPLDGLEPVRPEAVRLEHRSQDVERVLQALDLGREGSAGHDYDVMVYRGQDGICYAGLENPWTNSYQTDVFLTIRCNTDGERIQMGRFQNLLGRDGFWIRYPVMMGSDHTDYYYFDRDGALYRLASAGGIPQAVDLDGDGQDELVWSEPGIPDRDAGAVIVCRRNGEVYQIRVQPLLRAVWPEFWNWEYDELDPYSRCIRLSGTLEMPDSWEGRSASFRRDIYFDGENLRIYKEEPVYTDHIRSGIDAPAAVLEAARRLVLADYGEKHLGVRMEDGEIASAPVVLDDWRISSLTQVSVPRMGPDLEVEAWMLDYQFHVATPETVSLAGAAYLDEDCWLGGMYAGACCLFFRIGADGERVPLYQEEHGYGVYPESPLFPGMVLELLLKNRMLLPSEAEPAHLLWMIYGDKIRAMDLLGTYEAAEREAALSALAEYAVRAGEEESDRFREILDTLERSASQLTEAGDMASRTLLEAAGRAG